MVLEWAHTGEWCLDDLQIASYADNELKVEKRSLIVHGVEVLYYVVVS